MYGGWFLEAIEVARKAVEAASDKQASDIILLDTREVCGFADYFVICSGDSDRQIKAIYDEIWHRLKKESLSPPHHEGTLDSGWFLLDFGEAWQPLLYISGGRLLASTRMTPFPVFTSPYSTRANASQTGPPRGQNFVKSEERCSKPHAFRNAVS